ncbi:DeoR/GlpR family DNA-binding transcription regulator [Streptomyces coffeae]|uniref:Lactose phosphotransferase system repressor n=1 Tax=Streptomyces coffeae TaxID=621382 RepID=A0ABS1NCP8_9ACTN|nr:DeoR/GlpR family DNA-binding transcription regulator [Streptomyces coffeae]MBL1097732.1 DeoR/GlpR transcriptional regulator [Streptomyces coffeae]
MTDTSGAPDRRGDGDRAPSKLSPKGRREKIADQVFQQGQVSIEDLVQDLAVSQMTVYRDLDILERQGFLRKVRGGATAAPSALFESNLRWRSSTMLEEKQAICEAALEEVEPGQAIIVDDSSTVLPFITELPSRGSFTVISNSLQVINKLADEPEVQVIALGGVYQASFNAFVGMFTADMARSLRADVAYISVSAVDSGHCYHQSQEEALVKRALLAAARRKVLLVDHTKFGRQALYQLGPLSDFDLVISDRKLPKDEQDALHAMGVRLQLAPAESSE